MALGDVSDDSHVEGASLRCFSAVLVAEAAEDGRELSFAGTADEVISGWGDAMMRSGVKRVIWVTDRTPPSIDVNEVAIVDAGHPDVAVQVAELDDAQEISSSSAS